MKVKDGYILKKVMGSYMIISLSESESSIAKMQTLNETGAFLWDELSKSSTEEALVKRLTEEYDVDSSTALKDVSAFLKALEQSNLLEK